MTPSKSIDSLEDDSFEVLAMPTPQQEQAPSPPASRPSSVISPVHSRVTQSSDPTALQHAPSSPSLACGGRRSSVKLNDPIVSTSMIRRDSFIVLVVRFIGLAMSLGGIVLLVDARINHLVTEQVESMRGDFRFEIQSMHAQYKMHLQHRAAVLANAAMHDEGGFDKGGQFSSLFFQDNVIPVTSVVDTYNIQSDMVVHESTVVTEGTCSIDEYIPHHPLDPSQRWNGKKYYWTLRTIWDDLVVAGKTCGSLLIASAIQRWKDAVLFFELQVNTAYSCVSNPIATEEESGASCLSLFMHIVLVIVCIAALDLFLWYVFGRNDDTITEQKSPDRNKGLDPEGRIFSGHTSDENDDDDDDVIGYGDAQEEHPDPFSSSTAATTTPRMPPTVATLDHWTPTTRTTKSKRGCKNCVNATRLRDARRAAATAYVEGRLGR